MYNGTWQYPRDIVQPRIYDYSCHYNMILEKDHIVYLNETPIILVGHNYTSGILKHDYLGSQAVVRDLKRMNGWNQGFIT